MPELNVGVAQASRVRCYLAGGKDYYRTDRIAAEAITAAHPAARLAIAACKGFEHRALEALAHEGHTQFIVFGAGFDVEAHKWILPSRPDARILYVGDDELVVVHGRALDFNNPAVEWTDGSLTTWRDVLDAAGKVGFDLTQPIAVVMNRHTEFMSQSEPAVELVGGLFGELPPGSALMLCQTVADFNPGRAKELQRACLSHGIPHTPRSRQEFAEFFAGLDVMEPGIAPPQQWRPSGPFDQEADDLVSCLSGVGIKPQTPAR